MVETVQLDADGNYLELGNHRIPGVPNPGSELRCAYLDPAGSMTGRLFPSGRRRDELDVPAMADLPLSVPFRVEATLIDSANPFVFVAETALPRLGSGPGAEAQRHQQVEQLRRVAAVAMGLAPSLEAAAQTRGTPKAAMLSSPAPGEDADIRVQAYSMGKPHPSFQLTGAICLASALCFPGTVAAELSGSSSSAPPPQPTTTQLRAATVLPASLHGLGQKQQQQHQQSPKTERAVRVAHPKGVIDVGVELDAHGDVASCAVTRTARRLISGDVYYYV